MNAEFAVAVHSLVFLARRGGTSTSEEIARSVCTHPARVRKVLSRLKKAQLVSSREGHQDGGYAAMRAAEDVTLLDVLNALETRVVPPIRPCADSDPDCLIASGMAGAMERLTGRLDDLCRGELARVSLADVQKEIFDSLKDGDNPSVGSADSIPQCGIVALLHSQARLQVSLPYWAHRRLLHPQFAMVVPLRSQARLRHFLAHWAYYGLFPPQAAAFVRPTGCAASFAPFGKGQPLSRLRRQLPLHRGAFWEVGIP